LEDEAKARGEAGFMKKQAKVRSKGQITARKESPFAKYMGIGNPGIGKGKKALQRWMRELRGHDED
jgi:hypothetical protein